MTTVINTPVIGASITQIWKPQSTVGVLSDPTAPFALGTTLMGTNGKACQFCRVAAAGIAIGATAGITAGVTVTAASGNTWTNETGVALIVGDYVFLTSSITTA